jgi:hypothetical protein
MVVEIGLGTHDILSLRVSSAVEIKRSPNLEIVSKDLKVDIGEVLGG